MQPLKELLTLAEKLQAASSRLQTSLTPTKLQDEVTNLNSIINELAGLLRRVKGERKVKVDKKLEKVIAGLRNMALDLREGKQREQGESLEYDADKLDKYADDLLDVLGNVRGGGTGND
jgi:hypothetical protein